MTIWRIRISRWVRNAADTHSEHVMLFSCDSGYTHKPECCVVLTLAVILQWPVSEAHIYLSAFAHPSLVHGPQLVLAACSAESHHHADHGQEGQGYCLLRL